MDLRPGPHSPRALDVPTLEGIREALRSIHSPLAERIEQILASPPLPGPHEGGVDPAFPRHGVALGLDEALRIFAALIHIELARGDYARFGQRPIHHLVSLWGEGVLDPALRNGGVA